uniref:Uncharacterized protein n=1 Tax=Medicago truncatula TaxID=3880 RepID=I3SUV5_MEDTR|nr:unknown [Medicago truncatula]
MASRERSISGSNKNYHLQTCSLCSCGFLIYIRDK